MNIDLWSDLSENQRITYVMKSITGSTTLGASGKLVAEQAQNYMVVATQEATLLKEPGFNIMTMLADSAYLSQILGDQISLFPAEEARAISSELHSAPTFQGPLMTARKLRSVYQISYDAVRESLSGEGLIGTMMMISSQSAGRDLERMCISGDTSLGNTTRLNKSLKAFNGFLKQATAHVYDHESGVANSQLWARMLRAMPSQFAAGAMKALRYYTSWQAYIQYAEFKGDRPTAQGDKDRDEYTDLTFRGIPIVPLQLMAEGVGTNNLCTSALLTDPKNLTLGVRDEVRLKFGFDMKTDVYELVTDLKAVAQIAVADAIVKAINIKVLSA